MLTKSLIRRVVKQEHQNPKLKPSLLCLENKKESREEIDPNNNLKKPDHFS